MGRPPPPMPKPMPDTPENAARALFNTPPTPEGGRDCLKEHKARKRRQRNKRSSAVSSLGLAGASVAIISLSLSCVHGSVLSTAARGLEVEYVFYEDGEAGQDFTAVEDVVFV